MFSQRYGKTWFALHAIRGFRMQRDPKGNRLPFVTAPKVIWALLASCHRVTEHRMQYTFIFADFLGFCRRLLIPFCILQKGIRYLLEQKQKGPSNPFKQSYKGVFIHLLYKPIFTMKADPWKMKKNSESSK